AGALVALQVVQLDEGHSLTVNIRDFPPQIAIVELDPRHGRKNLEAEWWHAHPNHRVGRLEHLWPDLAETEIDQGLGYLRGVLPGGGQPKCPCRRWRGRNRSSSQRSRQSAGTQRVLSSTTSRTL